MLIRAWVERLNSLASLEWQAAQLSPPMYSALSSSRAEAGPHRGEGFLGERAAPVFDNDPDSRIVEEDVEEKQYETEQGVAR